MRFAKVGSCGEVTALMREDASCCEHHEQDLELEAPSHLFVLGQVAIAPLHKAGGKSFQADWLQHFALALVWAPGQQKRLWLNPKLKTGA